MRIVRRILLWGLGVFVGLPIVVIVLALIFAPSDQEADGPAASAPATPTATSEPTATPSASQVISEALGSSNREVDRVRVTVNETGFLLVEWAINDNLTEGMIKGGAKIDVLDMLEAVDRAGIAFTWITMHGTFPLTDAFGNTEETQVVRAIYMKDTVDRINFDGLLFDNVYRIADELGLHPVFKE